MPILHMICGLPGAGKSTLARQLEAETGAVRFTPDEWLRHLGYALHDETARERIETLQWLMAERCLKAGCSVILENGFWSRAERDRYRIAAGRIGAHPKLHFLDIPIDELKRRIAARNRGLPPEERVRADDLDGWAALFERPSVEELTGRVSPGPIDGSMGT